jgi:hypothetical protein
VLPTFLDVPGQHGHHRAMTRAAETAVRLAADPAAFPEHFAEGLAPWQVAKFYLPAWSGGGETYDDEVPPPPATLALDVAGLEPVTGVGYGHIGEWSRYYHASQGMGRWRDLPNTARPLHLKHGPKGSRHESSILDDLPGSLADLAQAELPRSAEDALTRADGAIVKAVEAFPDRVTIIDALAKAAADIETALSAAPAAFLAAHGHRLRRKLSEIDIALVEADQVFVRATAEPAALAPGACGLLKLHFAGNAPEAIEGVDIRLPLGVSAERQEASDRQMVFLLTATSDAPFTRQYAPAWSSLGGNGNGFVEITARIAGRSVKAAVDLEEPLTVAPSHSLTLSPNAVILPLSGKARTWEIKAESSAGDISFAAPEGWRVEKDGRNHRLYAPAEIAPGLIAVTPTIDGKPAMRLAPIAYPHIGRTVFREPELLRVLALELKLPEGARIGYVGGGADHVGLWLARMGLHVTELDEQALAGDLSRFTTLVVGIFAFGIRRDLAAATARLHHFVEDGGHLLTLYHRPSDGWNPDGTPPRRLEIGSPSVRWRVTDAAATVTVLEGDHPLLKGPNEIAARDWEGWDKERGLYFASRWDEAYRPLLAMHDPDEQPLKGALVSARIGKGRHTHTSLVLHHQLDKLVPGAFRLIANLVQPA